MNPLLFLLLLCCAQAPVWQHQAPTPTPASVNDVQMLSDLEAWAVSEYAELLHTADGGLTWSSTTLVAGVPSLQCVHFLDALTGWVAGNGIWYTTDGGDTWEMAVPWGTIYDICFTDALHGWACGNGGAVYRSTDGGRTWSTQALGSIATLSGIFFLDDLRGWVVSIEGDLHRSTDGGLSWQPVLDDPSYSNLNTVWFADAQEGWVLGGRTILHTRNGGASWEQLSPPSGTWMQKAFFLDRGHSWGVGDGKNIVHTTDGWQTSQTQILIGTGTRLWGVGASDPQHAMAVGEFGILLSTADAGSHWVERQSGAAGYTNRITVNDPAHAWGANDGGDVVWTATGGSVWRRSRVAGFDQYGRVLDVDFEDDNRTGWAVGVSSSFGGDTGTISKSVDGGRTWQVRYTAPPGSEFRAVATLDASTVVAAGFVYTHSGLVVRSEDGGTTWSNVTPPVYYYSSLDFLDANTGWMSGAAIYKTTNGGRTWSLQHAPLYGAEDISFADPLNGWAVGFFGTLLHTTDGGQRWTQQDSAVIGDTTLLGVDAVSPSVAWVAGTGGFVARTTDGGRTWQRETISTNALNSFPAVAFLDRDHGWIGGSSVPPRGGIWQRSSGALPGFALVQNRLVRGRTGRFEATGAHPGAPVFFLYSFAGYGSGPCVPQLGLCLDLLPKVTVLGRAVADGAGRAALSFLIPDQAPFLEVHCQALELRGSSSAKTNTTSALIEP